MTVNARVQWILDNTAQPDGQPWSAKSLSRAMGLSDAHVGMVARGDVEDPRGSFLAALAKTAGVNGHWLLTGEGPPPRPAVAPWRDLPAWGELIERAKLLAPDVPAWAWERAGDSAQLALPATPALLIDVAVMFAKHSPAEPSR